MNHNYDYEYRFNRGLNYRRPFLRALCLLAGVLCLALTWVAALWSIFAFSPFITIALNVCALSLLAYGWMRARQRDRSMGYLLLACVTIGYLIGALLAVQLVLGFTQD
jgi:uncharacterized membrane protein YhaH (DUF805 family)